MNLSINKRNRSLAAGTVFPDAALMIERLRYYYASKLSNKQLVVLLVVWLQGKLVTIEESKQFPNFYRLKSSHGAQENGFRVIKESAVSWVEFSIAINESEYMWIPVPRAFKALFWRVLQQCAYGKPLLSGRENDALWAFWKSKIIKNKADFGVKVAHKTAWANYFRKYCQADSRVSSNAKEAFLGSLHHQASTAYQTQLIGTVRCSLYQMMNRASDRLFTEAKKWDSLSDFFREVAKHKLLPDMSEKEASYLKEHHSLIAEINIQYKTHYRNISKVKAIRVGTNSAAELATICNLFHTLNSQIQSTYREVHTLRELCEYHNLVVNTLALQMIALTGIRPTHQISPVISNLYKNSFTIKDKGQSRKLLLSDFLQEQIQRYLSLRQKIQSSLMINEMPSHLLFVIDENLQPRFLTAKSLRQFMHAHCPNHVPYQLRKAHAQMLQKLNLPTHLIDRVMGHTRSGEHDGSVSTFASEEQTILEVLNKLPALFKMGLLP